MIKTIQNKKKKKRDENNLIELNSASSHVHHEKYGDSIIKWKKTDQKLAKKIKNEAQKETKPPKQT